MPRRPNLVNLLRSISAKKTMRSAANPPPCGWKPISTVVTAPCCCATTIPAISAPAKSTVSPLEALSRLAQRPCSRNFLGRLLPHRRRRDAVAADTDDVVDASFGEPATAGSGAPRRRGSGLASRISEQSEALLQEAAKHAAEFGCPRWIPNICCWRWPTATWSEPSRPFKIKVDDLEAADRV